MAGPLLARGERELVATEPTDNVALMFERLAKDPSVDVEKLQRLIDMQRDILRHNAEAQFWEAFATMQGELPTITEDGSIVVEGQVRSRYSTNENIQECIRPILQKHGFALSFRNIKGEKTYTTRGILAHRGGHKETDDFESLPDNGGRMNDIQRIGSMRSYGQRYTTISLLNIVSRAPQDRDRDGAGTKTRQPSSAAPAGYDDWLANLEAVADEGMPAFSKMWNDSKPEYRKYLTDTAPELQRSIKAKAAKAKAS